MASTDSAGARRATARRRVTLDEALDHAERIVGEQGVGARTVSEVARRMEIRPPSLYKYFPSLHAIYDALFARGNERLTAYVDDAVRDREPGLDRLLETCRAMVRWSMLNKELATRCREELHVAVVNGALTPAADADADETLRLLTSLTDQALAMFVDAHASQHGKAAPSGRN